MKTAKLVKILLVMGLVWLGLMMPTWWNFHVVDRHAAGYRTAWMTVSATYCGVDGNPERCRLEGTIDGAKAELVMVPAKGEADAEGARIKVLYNPQLPAFGTNHQSLQVIEWSDDVGAAGRRFRFFAMALAASSLLLTLAANVLFLFIVRRRTGIRGEIPEADLGGAKPVFGVPLLGLGLTFLLWQIPRFAWGGLILGAVLTVLGALLLRSRHLRVEKSSRSLTL